jgi:hypothetical protein
MYLTDIDQTVDLTNRNVEMYIGRITDQGGIEENPFLRLELPFPTEGFEDIRTWSDRIDPILNYSDYQRVILEFVSFNYQSRLLQLLHHNNQLLKNVHR